MAQILKLLLPVWDTKTEFWGPGFSMANPGCCSHLERVDQLLEDPSLFVSVFISLPLSEINRV